MVFEPDVALFNRASFSCLRPSRPEVAIHLRLYRRTRSWPGRANAELVEFSPRRRPHLSHSSTINSGFWIPTVTGKRQKITRFLADGDFVK